MAPSDLLSDPKANDPTAAPTSGDLLELIRHALTACGHSPDYVAGYIAAQQADGTLRSFAPAWIRKSHAARLRTMANQSRPEVPSAPVRS